MNSNFVPGPLAASLSALLADLLALPEDGRGNPENEGALLLRHGLFDSEYYLAHYEDVREAEVDPACHYAGHGFREGRFPGKWLEDMWNAGLMEGSPAPQSLSGQIESALAALLMHENAARPVILRQGSYESLYDLPLYVHWSITSKCNYRCSYCSFFHARKGMDLVDPAPEQLFQAVDKLIALNRPAYEFVLLGGEPTVCPALPELLDYMDRKLGDRLKQIVIVTNGSRNADYLNQFAGLASRIFFQVMNSVHLEFRKPEDLYDLARNIDPAIQLNLLLMAHPEKTDLVREIFARLCDLRERHPFNLVIHPIYGLPDFAAPDPRYPADFHLWREEAQRKFNAICASESVARMKAGYAPFVNFFWETWQIWGPDILPAGDRFSYAEQGLLNFHGKYCVTGAHLLRIEETGRLSGATCGHSNTGLNIYSDELDCDKFMQIVRCPVDFCVCSDNDLLMKFADEKEAGHFLKSAQARQKRLAKIK